MNFILNYHIHGVEKGLNELCGLLKTVESDIKKSGHVMAIKNKPSFKKKGNSWKKKGVTPGATRYLTWHGSVPDMGWGMSHTHSACN